MKKHSIFLLLFIFFCTAGFGQATSYRGQVIDQSGQGIPYAFVIINDQYVPTGSDGRFQFSTDQGTLIIQAEQLGYEVYTSKLTTHDLKDIQITLKDSPIVLEEILVSERSRFHTAQSAILQDEAKQSSQPRDVGDLLKGVPGFGLIKRGGYALDPVFRSFKYEQLNLVYDGGIQVTHACPARMDPASTHINPDEIEKLELIKGPFSVRYGPSMGGVINIVTKAPALDSDGLGAFVETGYETNGAGKLLRGGLNAGGRQWGMELSGGHKDYDNYQNGDGLTIPTAFQTSDYSLKSSFRPTDNQLWSLSWRQSFGRDILHAGLMMDTDKDDSSVLALDYQARNLGKTLFSLSAKAYGSRVDHVMSNQRRPNFMMTEAVAEVQSTTLGGKIEAGLTPAAKTLLYAGLDYRYVGRQGDRTRLLKRNMMTGELLPEPKIFLDPIWQDAGIHTLGLYLENQWLPSAQWSLLGGLRMDVINTTLGDPAADFTAQYAELETNNEINISGHISLNYFAGKDWQLQLALGRGVRTANMIERYINHFTVGRDPYEYLGNPNLRPEANHQAELSARFENEEWSASGNIFYSYITDFITARIDPELPRKYMPMSEPRFARRFTNIDAATQAGFEGQIAYRWHKNWSAGGQIAYTHARNLDWKEPLAEIPPLEGALGLRYQRAKWWADGRLRMVANQNRISENFGETTTPGFQTLDLRLGLTPWKSLSLGFSALNLLDENYYEHLSRVYLNMPESGLLYEPGKNFTFFIAYKL